VRVEGHRIGKGQGLSDLEYGMMVSAGLVNNSTVVMTVVHDCQVIDLSDDLFHPHNVPVDYIVTPTRVISCGDHGNLRPPGILWSLLGPNDLDRIPVLRRLRYREWKSGKNVRLSGEESDPDDLEDVILPEPDISRHGDFRKPKPKPSGNRDRNFEKPSREKLTAGGQQEVTDGNGEDGEKESSTKMTADQRKTRRFASVLIVISSAMFTRLVDTIVNTTNNTLAKSIASACVTILFKL